MVKFNSTGEPDTYKATVLFPNKKGVHILKRKTLGEADVYEVCLLTNTTHVPNDLDYSTLVVTNKVGCVEVMDKIRILSPD